RRRHTRFSRDWSSDVCSSDLGSSLVFDYHLPPELRDEAGADYACAVAAMAGREGEPWQCSAAPETVEAWLSELGWRIHEDIDERSEERRVGNERRTGRARCRQ